MKYKHIVFDIDGTLIDTEYMILFSLQKTVMQIKNINLGFNELNFALGIPGRDALRILEVADPVEALKIWAVNMKELLHTVIVFDGIKEVLEELKNEKIILGIVTSKRKSEYLTDFIPFGISEYFKTIICADDTELHKPNSDPLVKYLEKSGIGSKEVLYIGDSIYDMQCATAAGIDFGLALWGCNSENPIEATYILFHPREVRSILQSLSSY